MAKILIVTPASRGSRKGNRVTADRWAAFLRELGHRVAIKERYRDGAHDVLIALHARKSAPSINRFAQVRPASPIVVALTGTDLYGDITTSTSAQRSLQLATKLVLLQPYGILELHRAIRGKAVVIYQSAEPPMRKPTPLGRSFEICVAGHLRPVKDPFRAALAARHLPTSSRIRVSHLGAALTPAMAERAQAEMLVNMRYRWLGERSRVESRKILARSRLLIVSSRMEGGANVVSEAVVCGVPVVASRISGSMGLLGDDYCGYFNVGDTRQLSRLMLQCETDEDFYATLKDQCDRIAPLFEPRRERESWRALVTHLTG